MSRHAQLCRPYRRPSRTSATSFVGSILRGFLSGGWAADAWLGRQTRDHGDVDITVFHHDQSAVFEHFSGWAMVAHDPNVADDTTEQWNGRHLDLPAHIHLPELTSPLATSPTDTHAAFEFEFLLNERSGQDWVLNQEFRMTVVLDRRAIRSAWGIPTAPPEVVLFFKAGGNLTTAELQAGGGLPRARDEQDFFALLPTLTDAARVRLRDLLTRTRPGHPWLAHLAR
jgi:Aminoglycoside-2''-adenylyltransferase